MPAMDGAISYEMAGAIGAGALALGGLIAGVLVRYYTERTAILDKIEDALNAVEAKWDAKFETHRQTVSASLRDIHGRIDRVDRRGEDRLTAHLGAIRSEMQQGFGQVFGRLDAVSAAALAKAGAQQ